jgi:predicted ATPase/DNA-binding CsgD family transcriptional regulator
MEAGAVFPQANDFRCEPLTRREREILTWLVDNRSNREIASGLTIAPSSVKWYTRQIYAKLGINDRRQVAPRARELGLIATKPEEHPISPSLPAQTTPFIGRQTDLENVSQLVMDPDCRLLTLTGTGGVGKTRLALRAAEGLQAIYPDGVWLVELSPLDDPDLVDQTVAAIFGLHNTSEQTYLAILRQYMHDKQLLLILDNCEHVVETCARLADQLLKTCPRLNILATSREALGIDGEILYYVPSLTFPDPVQLPPFEKLLGYEAIRLFVDRSRVVAPGFTLTRENALAVAQICKRLDGIPLALELAAARVKVLDVEQVALRLEERFKLLVGGSRTALPRHQTMRASLDWSYQILTHSEKILLQKLSVFSGGWTLEAAEDICSDESLPPARVLDLLAQLINKSLVIVERGSERESRYYLQETVWEYAREKLLAAGNNDQAYRCHCDYYLRLSEFAANQCCQQNVRYWQKKLFFERDNMRTALAWSIDEAKDPTSGLKLINLSMYMVNWMGGSRPHQEEGCHWLRKGLELAAKGFSIAPATQAQALVHLAAMDNNASSDDRNCLLDQAAQLAQSGTLDTHLLDQIQILKDKLLNASTSQGRSLYQKAIANEQMEVLNSNRTYGDLRQVVMVLKEMGNQEKTQRHFEKAVAMFAEAIQICSESGWIDLISGLLKNLAHNDVLWANTLYADQARFHYLRAVQLLGIDQAILREAGLPDIVENKVELERTWTDLHKQLDDFDIETELTTGIKLLSIQVAGLSHNHKLSNYAYT